MPTITERITQFENMAEADPDNDMAHFSLGNAYLQADRFAEAAKSLQKCVEINPDMSKAYQLAGEAMIKAGWEDMAVDVLIRGFEVASSKGDLMPKNAMGDLLRSIGREPPQTDAKSDDAAEKLIASGAFICKRTGRPGRQLEEPPFRGPIGEWIQKNIAAETWREWIEQGTKVINEMRLDFSREEDQATYDTYMHDYRGIKPEEITDDST